MSERLPNQTSVPTNPSDSEPGGFASLHKGLNRVIESPRLLLGLWLLSLFTGLLATLPARAMLRDVLALRPLAERIAKGEYDVGLLELMNDNPAAMAAVTSAVMVAVLGFFALHAVIAGGVLSRLSPTSSARYVPAGGLLGRAVESSGAMIKLELLFGFAVRTPLLLFGAAVAGFAIGWSKVGELSWQSLTSRLAPVIVLFLLLWSVASIWLNLARLQRLDDDKLSTWQAFLLGVRQLGQRQVLFGALLVAVLGVIGHGGLFFLGRMLTVGLDAKLLILAAFAVRQGLSILRNALSLLVMATTCELAEPKS
ncbi:MAG: hypothetical protein JNM83_11295 [Myxococcales bacterium]|nr:hypothetical protein [Myxococcales bacterium]